MTTSTSLYNEFPPLLYCDKLIECQQPTPSHKHYLTHYGKSISFHQLSISMYPRCLASDQRVRSFLLITPFKKSRSGVWPPIKKSRSFLSIHVTLFKKSRSGVWPPIKKCRNFLSITPFKKSRSSSFPVIFHMAHSVLEVWQCITVLATKTKHIPTLNDTMVNHLIDN